MSPPAFLSGNFPAPSVRHGQPHRITPRRHAASDGHPDGTASPSTALAGGISASDPAWRESRPGKALPAGADVRRADVLAQAVARRVRHPAGTGNIPLNLRSFVDG